MSNERKVVWITGAGKGIGRALALRMASEGWLVAASARTARDLEDLAASATGSVHAFPLDVADVAATGRVISEIEDRLGLIDVAILNAGTYIPTGVSPFSALAFRQQVDVNFMGTVNGLEHLVPRFVSRRRGHIAVMASVAGYRGLPTSAAYGATKAALINLCEALRIELEPHDVCVSVICPGFVKTPLTDRNQFPMPFLISAESAADHIVQGLSSRRFEIAFPPLFAAIMKTLRILPAWAYFAIARRLRAT